MKTCIFVAFAVVLCAGVLVSVAHADNYFMCYQKTGVVVGIEFPGEISVYYPYMNFVTLARSRKHIFRIGQDYFMHDCGSGAYNACVLEFQSDMSVRLHCPGKADRTGKIVPIFSERDLAREKTSSGRLLCSGKISRQKIEWTSQPDADLAAAAAKAAGHRDGCLYGLR